MDKNDSVSTLVSAIIPSKDRPKAIISLVRELAMQEGNFELEVIIIDDGSQTPYNVAILLQEVHLRVSLLRHKEKYGAPVSRNEGIKAAKGEYILMLDDDIKLLNSDFISKALEILKDEPEVGIVTPRKIDENRVTGEQNELSTYRPRWFDGFLVGSEENEGPISFGCMIYLARTEALHVINGYDTIYGKKQGHSWREESDLQARLRAEGYVIYYLPSISILHQVGKTGGQSKDLKNLVYWLAHNHVIFINRHFSYPLLRTIGFLIYRVIGRNLLIHPLYLPWSLKGWVDGLLQVLRKK